MNRLLFAFGAFLAISLGYAVGAQGSTWLDANGASVNPMASRKGHPTVLIFLLTDCPIANTYAPEIHRIIDKYSAKGVSFHIVYEDSRVTADMANKHAREYGYHCSALLDPHHTLSKKVGAKVSPEAVVVGGSGTIAYRGRIDNRAADYGRMRPRATRQDLRLTLDALMKGKPAPNASTPCVGCFLPVDEPAKSP